MDNNELEIQLTYLRMMALEENTRVGATFEALEGRVDTLEDVPLPAWGAILGSLSAQTDLQDVLDTIVTSHGGLTDLGVDDHTQYLLADGTRTLAGNLTVTGTVDGRDVAADGAKLDGVEASATADQTGAEIKVAYEGELDTNAFTDLEQSKLAGIESGAVANHSSLSNLNKDDHTHYLLADGTRALTGPLATSSTIDGRDLSVDGAKLDGIEAAATADQTGAQIKVAYEAEANTNAFTDAEQTKLSLCTTSSATAPSTPSDGELWMDLGSHSIYYWDATNSLWLDTSRENTLWGKPGASGTGSGFFLLSANLNLGTYGLEIEEDMILDSVAFSCDGTTSGSWTFRVKKNGTQIYGLAAPTSGSYDRVYSGDLIGSGHTFAAGDRISTEFGSGAGSASFTDSSLIVYYRRTI